MYTVSKGPSKFVAKTRRGISQNLEIRETFREIKKPIDNEDSDVINVPKPVFNLSNGKKSSSMRTQQETISPQHEEIIKFIYDSWTSVCNEGEQDTLEHTRKQNSSAVVYYEESEPNVHLQDFKPFDLESWWGKRLFNTITKSIP